jgi:hypothetical protein
MCEILFLYRRPVPAVKTICPPLNISCVSN